MSAFPDDMKCPHCRIAFHYNPSTESVIEGEGVGQWFVMSQKCPTCKRPVIELYWATSWVNHGDGRYIPQSGDIKARLLAYPRAAAREALSPDVPEKFACDYREAVLVFNDSAKASAALSRRCLQNILREHYGIKEKDLAPAIDKAISQKIFPGHITDGIDGIRNVGNFAAHPQKSIASGEILDVEPGEAEWNLDVLEAIFDFAFVEPARTKKKRDALNAKLAAAGKPPLKG